MSANRALLFGICRVKKELGSTAGHFSYMISVTAIPAMEESIAVLVSGRMTNLPDVRTIEYNASLTVQSNEPSSMFHHFF